MGPATRLRETGGSRCTSHDAAGSDFKPDRWRNVETVREKVLVVRENFQDLYLVLKERHKHLDSRKNKEGFNKVMDTKRHVWKVSAPEKPLKVVMVNADR
jgi:hypothetical protein